MFPTITNIEWYYDFKVCIVWHEMCVCVDLSLHECIQWMASHRCCSCCCYCYCCWLAFHFVVHIFRGNLVSVLQLINFQQSKHAIVQFYANESRSFFSLVSFSVRHLFLNLFLCTFVRSQRIVNVHLVSCNTNVATRWIMKKRNFVTQMVCVCAIYFVSIQHESHGRIPCVIWMNNNKNMNISWAIFSFFSVKHRICYVTIQYIDCTIAITIGTLIKRDIKCQSKMRTCYGYVLVVW